MKNKLKKKILYSIPFNGDLNLIKWAIDSGQVYEVYFAGPEKSDASDPYENAQFHSEKKLAELIRICNRNRVSTNLLINKNSLFFENMSTVVLAVKRLQRAGRIDFITVADQFGVSFLKKEFPSIPLQSSIYMGIDNVGKAREALKMGIEILCLDPALNRNERELKKIMALKKYYPKLAVKLLGTLTCYSNCFFAWRHSELPIFRRFLENNSFLDKKIFGNRLDIFSCYYQSNDIVDEIRNRGFIRPEDVLYYENNNLTDYIKIAFRNDSSDYLKEKMSAYFNRSYRGDLIYFFESNKHREIFCDNTKIPDGFIKKIMLCKKNCNNCNYCLNVAKKCMSIKKIAR